MIIKLSHRINILNAPSSYKKKQEISKINYSPPHFKSTRFYRHKIEWAASKTVLQWKDSI